MSPASSPLGSVSKTDNNPPQRASAPSALSADVGLLNPITVDGSYTLIAGLHRLEAAKQLGRAEIECTVCDINGIRAELAEIDENVIRRNLTNTDVSGLLARRKKLYETLHPETITRNCPSHVNNHQGSSDKLSSKCKVKYFVEDTAEKLGVSTRTVERYLYLAEHLTPKASEILKKMDKQPPRSELMKLARFEPDQQTECAAQLLSDKIKSVDTYLKHGEPEAIRADTLSAFGIFMERSSLLLDGSNNFSHF